MLDEICKEKWIFANSLHGLAMSVESMSHNGVPYLYNEITECESLVV